MRWISWLLVLMLAGPATAIPRKLAALVPDLSYLTTFAHDYGDSIAVFYFRGQSYQPNEASIKILPQLDWAKRPDRLLLGQAWAEEICLFGWEVITPEHRRGKNVPAPQAEILPDGVFRYTATALSMRGRSPGSQWTRWQIDIDPEGQITQTALASSQRHP